MSDTLICGGCGHELGDETYGFHSRLNVYICWECALTGLVKGESVRNHGMMWHFRVSPEEKQ